MYIYEYVIVYYMKTRKTIGGIMRREFTRSTDSHTK